MKPSEMKRLLTGLLDQAEAPITGLGVACVLTSDTKDNWLGFNREVARGTIHAETMAADRCGGKYIQHITIMSSLPGLRGLKAAAPCRECIERLWTNAATDATATLYASETRQSHQTTLRNARYSYKRYHSPGSIAGDEMAVFSGLEKLGLAECDATQLIYLLSALRQSPRGMPEVFVTGSASGRGGLRASINKLEIGCPYVDIDLIMIGDVMSDDINRSYESALSRLDITETPRLSSAERCEPTAGSFDYSYRAFTPRQMSDPDDRTLSYTAYSLSLPSLRPCLDRWPYTKPVGLSAIDICVGNSLESTMSRVYRESNWYVRVDLR